MCGLAISRKNVAELLVTRTQLQQLAAVAQALQERDGGDDAATRLLSGSFVRLVQGGRYFLAACRCLDTTSLDTGGLPRLYLEGVAAPVAGRRISDSNPFQEGEDAAYEATGRAELLALQQSLASAAETPAGLDVVGAAAAAWRKKVALHWAARLEELREQGVGTLLADMADPDRIAEQAAYMDRLPAHQPRVAAGLGPAHEQPAPPLQHQPGPEQQHHNHHHDHQHQQLQQGDHMPHLPQHLQDEAPELPPHLQQQQQQWAQQPALPHQPQVDGMPHPLPPAAAPSMAHSQAAELPPHLRMDRHQPVLPAMPASMANEDAVELPPHLRQLSQQQPFVQQQQQQQQLLPPPAMQYPQPWGEAPGMVQRPAPDLPPHLQPFGQPRQWQQQEWQQQEWQHPAPSMQRPGPPAAPPSGLHVAASQVQPAPVLPLHMQPQQAQQLPAREEPSTSFRASLQQAVSVAHSGKQQPTQQQPPQNQVWQGQGPPHGLSLHAQQLPPSGPLQQHLPLHVQQEQQQQQQQQRSGDVPCERLPEQQDVRHLQELLLQQLERGASQGQRLEGPGPHQQPGMQQVPAQPAHKEQAAPLQAGVPQPPAAGGGVEYSLLVANLGDSMTEGELESYFRLRYPSVTGATVPRLRSGERKGFGFVRFSSDEERQRALQEMDGHVLPGGRRIGTGLAGQGVVAGAGAPPGAPPAAPAGTAPPHAAAAGEGAPPVGSPRRKAAPDATAAAAVPLAARVRVEDSAAPVHSMPTEQNGQPHRTGLGAKKKKNTAGEQQPPIGAADASAGPPAAPAAAAAAAAAGGAAGGAPPLAAAAAAAAQAQAQAQAQMLMAGMASMASMAGMAPLYANCLPAALGAPAMLPTAQSWPGALAPPLMRLGSGGGGGFLQPGLLHLGSGGLPLPFNGARPGGPAWRGPGPPHGLMGGPRPRPPPPPPPHMPLPFNSGASSLNRYLPADAALSGHSGAAGPPHHHHHQQQQAGAVGECGSGAGESAVHSRGRARSTSSGGRTRSMSRSRSRSHSRSRIGRGRGREGSAPSGPGSRRVRSRSPRGPRLGQRGLPAAAPPADPARGSGGSTSIPVWVPSRLRNACHSCAFTKGLPFHASCLLDVLDELQCERNCLRGTGLTLRHLCDFLHTERWADIELRPDGPWVAHVHVPRS